MTIATNLLLLLYALIGSFFAAWTFWGFTSKNPAERTVEVMLAGAVIALWPIVALLLLVFSFQARIRKWRRMSR